MIAHPDNGAASHVQLLPASITSTALEICEAERLQPVLHTFEDGHDRLRWKPEAVTHGTRAFIDVRAGDPRLRPITGGDPGDLDTVFYIAVLAERNDLLRLRAAVIPALEDCADFLSEDPATPGFDC